MKARASAPCIPVATEHAASVESKHARSGDRVEDLKEDELHDCGCLERGGGAVARKLFLEYGDEDEDGEVASEDAYCRRELYRHAGKGRNRLRRNLWDGILSDDN